MLNSETTRAAFDLLNRMTPEQRKRIVESVSNADPRMLKEATERMNNMNESDFKKMTEQVKSTDPSKIATAAETLNQRRDYTYKVSLSLKEEGNVLHGQRKFLEALEKYKKANLNLEHYNDKDSLNLKMQCLLNVASCEHNLGHFSNSIEVCTECIKKYGKNRKAYYRRGLARQEINENGKALCDFKQALYLCDDTCLTYKKNIEEKIEALTLLLEKTPIPDIEEKEETETENEKMNDVQMETMMKMFRENPNLLDKPFDMLSKLSDDDLEMIMKGCNKNQRDLESFKAFIKSMDKENIKSLYEHFNRINPTTNNSNLKDNSSNSKTKNNNELEEIQPCPSNKENNVSEIESISDTNNESNGKDNLHNNLFSPEMISQMSNIINGMNPEDLTKKPFGNDISSMINNANMMAKFSEIFKNMDEDMIIDMIKSFNIPIPEAQASQMARTLKNITPGQMERIMMFADYIKKINLYYQKIKKIILSKTMVIVAILILLLAIVLRIYNIT